jgi:type II secretory pathway pseudopilin PulG
MRQRLLASRGITMFEVVLMLTATSALAAALMPTLTATIEHAETTAATTAMTDIQGQVLQMLNDVNFNSFTITGTSGGTHVEILVSDGDIPQEVSGTGSAEWQRPVDNATGLVDFIERHLVTNNPRGNVANDYPTAGGNRWRGAYLTSPVDPDPWGNRYAVNVEFLTGGSQDVVVFSSGPDEQIDSLYSQNGLTAGDDDLIVLVEP